MNIIFWNQFKAIRTILIVLFSLCVLALTEDVKQAKANVPERETVTKRRGTVGDRPDGEIDHGGADVSTICEALTIGDFVRLHSQIYEPPQPKEFVRFKHIPASPPGLMRYVDVITPAMMSLAPISIQDSSQAVEFWWVKDSSDPVTADEFGLRAEGNLSRGSGGGGGELTHWAVKVEEVDLDIDSDNDAGKGTPQRTEEEDEIEEEEKSDMPGKIVWVNRIDTDIDGIDNMYDGFDAFDQKEAGGSDAFVPIVFSVPADIDVKDLVVKFEYDDSDPKDVTRTGDPGQGYDYQHGGGRIRLWTKDGPQTRDWRDVSDQGDFVPSDVEIDLDDLRDAASGGSGNYRLYIEGITPSELLGDGKVKLTAYRTDRGGMAEIGVDTVAITVLGLEYVRFVGGKTVRTVTGVTASIDSPYITVDEAETINMRATDDGMKVLVDIRLKGRVGSKFASTIEGDNGIISEMEFALSETSMADPSTGEVEDKSILVETIDLNVSKTSNLDDWLYSYPYSASFDTTVTGVELIPGPNHFSLAVKDKVLGTVGKADVTSVILIEENDAAPVSIDNYNIELSKVVGSGGGIDKNKVRVTVEYNGLSLTQELVQDPVELARFTNGYNFIEFEDANQVTTFYSGSSSLLQHVRFWFPDIALAFVHMPLSDLASTGTYSNNELWIAYAGEDFTSGQVDTITHWVESPGGRNNGSAGVEKYFYTLTETAPDSNYFVSDSGEQSLILTSQYINGGFSATIRNDQFNISNTNVSLSQYTPTKPEGGYAVSLGTLSGRGFYVSNTYPNYGGQAYAFTANTTSVSSNGPGEVALYGLALLGPEINEAFAVSIVGIDLGNLRKKGRDTLRGIKEDGKEGIHIIGDTVENTVEKASVTLTEFVDSEARVAIEEQILNKIKKVYDGTSLPSKEFERGFQEGMSGAADQLVQDTQEAIKLVGGLVDPDKVPELYREWQAFLETVTVELPDNKKLIQKAHTWIGDASAVVDGVNKKAAEFIFEVYNNQALRDAILNGDYDRIPSDVSDAMFFSIIFVAELIDVAKKEWNDLSDHQKGMIMGRVCFDLMVEVALGATTGGLGKAYKLARKYGAAKKSKGLKAVPDGKLEIEAWVDDAIALHRTTRMCFTGATQVLTPNGYTPISEIQEGDYVLSKFAGTDATIYRKVVGTVVTRPEAFSEIVLRGESGELKIQCTEEHPFYSYEHSQFVNASQLRLGDKLSLSDGTTIGISEISHDVAMPEDNALAYNIEVEGSHTYFVGDLDGVGVWVHNTATAPCHIWLAITRNIQRKNPGLDGFELTEEILDQVTLMKNADRRNNILGVMDRFVLTDMRRAWADGDSASYTKYKKYMTGHPDIFNDLGFELHHAIPSFLTKKGNTANFHPDNVPAVPLLQAFHQKGKSNPNSIHSIMNHSGEFLPENPESGAYQNMVGEVGRYMYKDELRKRLVKSYRKWEEDNKSLERIPEGFVDDLIKQLDTTLNKMDSDDVFPLDLLKEPNP